MIGLEYFRRRNNMSGAELGKMIGVSRQSIHRWERKEQDIPLKRVQELADLFQVDELFITSNIKKHNYTSDLALEHDRIYGLYKRIMKHDVRAIDEIKSLDEAKSIIKIMSGSVWLNKILYPIVLELKG